ncbi:hypothetical protein [Pseudovibrio sp. Tun.PSC04-5.I4]|uniref:hypothetical protein n=1 Tax=Pseudovibrio sp. Tun.PSC04-5.I4 TaxID=1798213 RepID=UPI001AD94890|nr:hypothetical protein [Pseudovibrio sp. Tun.PSC04-5.I4]
MMPTQKKEGEQVLGSPVVDHINWQQLAAQNNANLYEHMFTAHSLPFQRSESHFQTSQEPLPFYSNIVTLAPNATEEQTSAIKTLCETAHFNLAVKDSFNTLGLTPLGF